MKRIVAGLLAIMMILSLSACGKKLFTVDYAKLNISLDGDGMSSNSISIVGHYDNEEKELDVKTAFKDCKYESCSVNGGGKQFSLAGDGTNAIEGGVTLTLKDANGKTREIKIDETAAFEVDDSGNSIKLLLPEDE